MAFAKFMASTAGRALRVIAGLALIGVGLFVLADTVGYALALIGLVPLLAGALDVCLVAPLFGAPFKGDEVRENV